MKDMDQAAKAIRNLALCYDEQEQEIRERGFVQFCEGTVFPEAVNRWIKELCHA